MRQKCIDQGLEVVVDSAGTANYHVGSPPDKRMIQTASKFGFDIANLRARQFGPEDFDDFDFIFTMDESNKSNVLRLAKNDKHRSKVFGFQEFAGVAEPNFVPDPYYGDAKDFEETFRIVEQSAHRIAIQLKNWKP